MSIVLTVGIVLIISIIIGSYSGKSFFEVESKFYSENPSCDAPGGALTVVSIIFAFGLGMIVGLAVGFFLGFAGFLGVVASGFVGVFLVGGGYSFACLRSYFRIPVDSEMGGKIRRGKEIATKLKSTAAVTRRALRQAQALLNLAELILPRKITSECFGDRFEALEEMAETVPGWRLQLEALISIGWAVLFTLREIAKPGALIAAIWRLLFGGPLT